MLYTCIEYVTEGVMKTVQLITARASGGLAVNPSELHRQEQAAWAYRKFCGVYA